MSKSLAESACDNNHYEHFLHTLIRRKISLERQKKGIKNKLGGVFNETNAHVQVQLASSIPSNRQNREW